MDADLIIMNEYCLRNHIEHSFVVLLYDEGLIDIRKEEGEEYLLTSQLHDLEQYTRMYYDLSINIEGIDAIRHMLERMNVMQREIKKLRYRLNRFEGQAGVTDYEF